uniref:Uncharacterized protein n=1 Tax=Plectus sambesii TaxID=2011161 RepID=A0A914UI64_9BILA
MGRPTKAQQRALAVPHANGDYGADRLPACAAPRNPFCPFFFAWRRVATTPRQYLPPAPLTQPINNALRGVHILPSGSLGVNCLGKSSMRLRCDFFSSRHRSKVVGKTYGQRREHLAPAYRTAAPSTTTRRSP